MRIERKHCTHCTMNLANVCLEMQLVQKTALSCDTARIAAPTPIESCVSCTVRLRQWACVCTRSRPPLPSFAAELARAPSLAAAGSAAPAGAPAAACARPALRSRPSPAACPASSAPCCAAHFGPMRCPAAGHGPRLSSSSAPREPVDAASPPRPPPPPAAASRRHAAGSQRSGSASAPASSGPSPSLPASARALWRAARTRRRTRQPRTAAWRSPGFLHYSQLLQLAHSPACMPTATTCQQAARCPALDQLHTPLHNVLCAAEGYPCLQPLPHAARRATPRPHTAARSRWSPPRDTPDSFPNAFLFDVSSSQGSPPLSLPT